MACVQKCPQDLRQKYVKEVIAILHQTKTKMESSDLQEAINEFLKSEKSSH